LEVTESHGVNVILDMQVAVLDECPVFVFESHHFTDGVCICLNPLSCHVVPCFNSNVGMRHFESDEVVTSLSWVVDGDHDESIRVHCLVDWAVVVSRVFKSTPFPLS